MHTFEQAYEICKQKFCIHMQNINEIPLEACGSTTGHYYEQEKGSDIYAMYNWMTSFATGLAPLYYRTDKNEAYLQWANRFQKHYHSKMFDTPLESMHDIGFLYSPYSVAMYQLTGDMHHREDALRAADELAKRFDLRGHYIDAWGKMDDDNRVGRAIIDCMMNIALLMWAHKETGNTFYRDVATLHADTTAKYFIRKDFSVAHSFDFDRAIGEMIRENNGCGYENGSHWARGTAWAVYGFSILARYTNSEKYRNLALNTVKKYFESMPDNMWIPVWDFRLPKDKPAKFCGNGNELTVWEENDDKNCCFNVDTSAAAITACGLLELYRQTNEDWLLKNAKNSLQALCCEPYFNADINTAGILSYQNGQMNYTTYGDFFFVEALQNYLYSVKTCW